MHHIAEAFPYLFADVLPDADDVAGRSHLHDLTVVRHAVECSVYQQPAFAEERLYVERHLNVGGIHILVLQDYRIEFQYASFFWAHPRKAVRRHQRFR